MSHIRPLLTLTLTALACIPACGDGPTAPEPAASPPVAAPTDASARPTTPADASAKPSTPADASAKPATPSSPTGSGSPSNPATPPVAPAGSPSDPTPTAAPPAGPAMLRVVAEREGSLSLMVASGMPVLGLEGEPVTLVDGAFTRRPSGAVGMPPCHDSSDLGCRIIAYAGPPGGAWVTIEETFERVGTVITTFHRTQDRWQRVPPPGDFVVGSYPVLVERGGAVLGFLDWGPNPDGDSWAGEASMGGDEPPSNPSWGTPKKYAARRRSALAKAERRWEQLAGAPAELPKLLPKQVVTDAVTTADGTLYALIGTVVSPDKRVDEPVWEGIATKDTSLHVWRPGAATAEIIAMPEGKAGSNLYFGGDTVLLAGASSHGEGKGGSERYLAVLEGSAWKRVPLDVPDREESISSLLGVAKASDGALWVALGMGWLEDEYADRQPLWRKPVDGPWQPVPLPDHAALQGGAMAYHLVGGAGEVWATLYAKSRVLVVSTQPGSAPPVVLPSAQELRNEREEPKRDAPE